MRGADEVIRRRGSTPCSSGGGRAVTARARGVRALVWFVPAIAMLSLGASTSAGEGPPNQHPLAIGAAPFRAGVVLVAFLPGVSAAELRSIERAVRARGLARLGPAIRPARLAATGREPLTPFVMRVSSADVLAAVDRLRHEAAGGHAEPDSPVN